VALIDLKTGTSVHAEHAVQLRAYREGEFVGRDDVVDEVLTALLHSATDLGVLHLAEDHWEYLALRDDPVSGEAFRGLLTFATWMAEHGDVETCVTARRTNRRCPVCSEPLEAQDVVLRPMTSAGVAGGRLPKIATHRGCTPGEEAQAA